MGEVRPEELRRLLASAAYAFLLFAGWYLIRPLREEIGQAQRDVLSRLWTGTFVGMLLVAPPFAWLVSRFPRRIFIPAVNRFFVFNILLFYVLLRWLPEEGRIWTERVFYVWTSVFNLFVISVMWSFMADIWTSSQGKRLFGLIAFGGTLGGIVGSLLASVLAKPIEPINLFLVAVLFLEGASQTVRILGRHARKKTSQELQEDDRPLAGNIITGVKAVARSPYLLGICAFIFLLTFCSAWQYYLSSNVIGSSIRDRGDRTALNAQINLAINTITALLQLVAFGRLVRRLGVGLVLTMLPLFCFGAFALIGTATLLATVVAFEILYRSGKYSLAKPSREVLFTVVSREEKYKSKSFLDTVVYRGGDMVNGWAFQGLKDLHLALGAIALTAIPVAGAWALLGRRLGRRQEALAREQEPASGPAAESPAPGPARA